VKQGTYVVYGQWLGKVDEAMDHVTLRMTDGSVCRITNADPELLVPQHDEVLPRPRPPQSRTVRMKMKKRATTLPRCNIEL
jgi:hypothetical protein